MTLSLQTLRLKLPVDSGCSANQRASSGSKSFLSATSALNHTKRWIVSLEFLSIQAFTDRVSHPGEPPGFPLVPTSARVPHSVLTAHLTHLVSSSKRTSGCYEGPFLTLVLIQFRKHALSSLSEGNISFLSRSNRPFSVSLAVPGETPMAGCWLA